MSDPAELRSEAQRAIFEKAAADPAYAASRGITAEFAKLCLDAHAKAGAPRLPDRVAAAARAPAPARKPVRSSPPQLLSSRRAEG